MPEDMVTFFAAAIEDAPGEARCRCRQYVLGMIAQKSRTTLRERLQVFALLAEDPHPPPPPPGGGPNESGITNVKLAWLHAENSMHECFCCQRGLTNLGFPFPLQVADEGCLICKVDIEGLETLHCCCVQLLLAVFSLAPEIHDGTQCAEHG